MTLIALIIICIFILVLATIPEIRQFFIEIINRKDERIKRKDIYGAYNIATVNISSSKSSGFRQTFNKWLDVFNPSLITILEGRKIYSAIEIVMIEISLGIQKGKQNLFTKRELQKRFSKTAQEFGTIVSWHSEELGITFEQYKNLNVFPPVFAERLELILES